MYVKKLRGGIAGIVLLVFGTTVEADDPRLCIETPVHPCYGFGTEGPWNNWSMEPLDDTNGQSAIVLTIPLGPPGEDPGDYPDPHANYGSGDGSPLGHGAGGQSGGSGSGDGTDNRDTFVSGLWESVQRSDARWKSRETYRANAERIRSHITGYERTRDERRERRDAAAELFSVATKAHGESADAVAESVASLGDTTDSATENGRQGVQGSAERGAEVERTATAVVEQVASWEPVANATADPISRPAEPWWFPSENDTTADAKLQDGWMRLIEAYDGLDSLPPDARIIAERRLNTADRLLFLADETADMGEVALHESLAESALILVDAVAEGTVGNPFANDVGTACEACEAALNVPQTEAMQETALYEQAVRRAVRNHPDIRQRDERLLLLNVAHSTLDVATVAYRDGDPGLAWELTQYADEAVEASILMKAVDGTATFLAGVIEGLFGAPSTPFEGYERAYYAGQFVGATAGLLADTAGFVVGVTGTGAATVLTVLSGGLLSPATVPVGVSSAALAACSAGLAAVHVNQMWNAMDELNAANKQELRKPDVPKELPDGVSPASILEGLSNRSLKHTQRHLAEFQKLDQTMTAERLRELGASLVKAENLISNPGAARLVFEAIVDIGGNETTVRAVLNGAGKLRSIHIRY